MNKTLFHLLILLILSASSLLTACAPQEQAKQVPPTQVEFTPFPTTQASPSPVSTTIEDSPMDQTQFANVLSVDISGEPSAYQFSVKISSPDTGCEQFADWWEVFNEEGQLLYRRILLHSHVDEQSFTRSGGPVPIAADTVVYVRAHMNTVGYGSTLMKGSVQDGFEAVEVEAGFGSDLERLPPQPEDCAF